MNLLDIARSALVTVTTCETAAQPDHPGVPGSARCWRVTRPNRQPIDVLFASEVGADDVRGLYPGAMVEPVAEARRRSATRAETEELRALIAEVLHADSEAERAETLTVACADADAALMSFRALVNDLRENRKWLPNFDTRTRARASEEGQ